MICDDHHVEIDRAVARICDPCDSVIGAISYRSM